MESRNLYFAQAEINYRREQVLRKWQPVSRRRRQRAEAVRRVISHLR